MCKRKVIGVIGGSEANEEFCALAEALGREIALRGYHLVNGGRGGVMRASAVGFASAREEGGGVAVAILPGSLPLEENEGLFDLQIPTGLGEARNVVIVKSADGIVAVDGSYGTLSEVAVALKMGVPLVGLRCALAERLGEFPNFGSPSEALDSLERLMEGDDRYGRRTF